jgi:hypothetical protein
MFNSRTAAMRSPDGWRDISAPNRRAAFWGYVLEGLIAAIGANLLRIIVGESLAYGWKSWQDARREHKYLADMEAFRSGKGNLSSHVGDERKSDHV